MKKLVLAAVAALFLAFPAAAEQGGEAALWNPSAPYPGDVVIGSEDAPVTVVEYASLTCPHCARFHRESLEAFAKGWIDTGKARLVYRHLPLDKSALAGALTVACVPEGNRAALIADLFGSVGEWAPTQDLSPPLKRVLGDSADIEDVIACFSAKGFAEEVMRPGTDAVNNGVSATPTFFVNGEKHVGFMSAEELGKAVDEAIARSLFEE